LPILHATGIQITLGQDSPNAKKVLRVLSEHEKLNCNKKNPKTFKPESVIQVKHSEPENLASSLVYHP